jgi:hypothetical protein
VDFDFDVKKPDELMGCSQDFDFDFSPTFDTFSQPLLPEPDIHAEGFRIQLGLPRDRPAAPKEPSKPRIYRPFSSCEAAEFTVRSLRKELERDLSRSISLPVAVGFNL